MKQIDQIAHAARRHGLDFTHLITVRAPLDVPDAEGKRKIVRTIGHLGEALKRRGQEHVGVTTFEKAPHLHAHHLVHVRPKNKDVVARFADGEVVHARLAVPNDVGYVAKQRRWLGPDAEKDLRERWKPLSRLVLPTPRMGYLAPLS